MQDMDFRATGASQQLSRNQILFGDNNLDLLKSIPDRSCRLIYIDPPFATQKTQKRDRITVKRDVNGTRTGFGGARYAVTHTASPQYPDSFDDFPAFIRPRIEEALRILTDDGSLLFHIDTREVHYAKVLIDGIFGRSSFINEIIWSYDYGGSLAIILSLIKSGTGIVKVDERLV